MRCIRGRWLLLLSAILSLAVLGTTDAQDKKGGKADKGGKAAPTLDRKEIDKRVYNTLKEIINTGADLYNSGDTQGCYRLYAGALVTTRAVLDHRPDLQKAIDDGLAEAEATPQLFQRAFVLRRVLDKIRADVRGGGGPAVKPVVKATVAGKVTLDGKPVAGADVFLKDNKDNRSSSKTDADGAYKIAELKPGRYKVAVVGKGVPPKYNEPESSGLSVVVKKGDNTHVIALKKPTPPPPTKGTVKGKVTLDGKPVQKGDVLFTDAKGKVTKTPLASNGTYTAENLAPGKYKVAVEGDGVPPQYTDPKTTPLTFDVKVGDSTNNIALKKPTPPPAPKGTVQGGVTLDGKPVAKGDVLLADSKGKVTKAAIRADGTYSAKDLAPGKYSVAVDAAGVDAKMKDPKTSGLTVDVKKGDNTLDIPLKKPTPPPPPPPPAKGTVKGKVTLDGKPVTKGEVHFVDSKGAVTKAPVGTDGTYTAKDLAPGKYTIAVAADGVDAKAKDPKTSGLTLDVKKGDNALEIKLAKPTPPPPPPPAPAANKGTVEGKVTLNGKPVAKGDLFFQDLKGTILKAEIADGEYSLGDVPVGKYQVGVDTAGVEAKTKEPKSSGLTADVKKGKNTLDFAVKGDKPE